MELGEITRYALAGVGAFLGYAFGEWTVLLQVLTAMIILDYLTNLLASGVEGRLSSKESFKEVTEKVGIFAMVAVAHFIDKATGGNVVKDAVTFFYIGNELISLIENGGRMGLPIPNVLKKAVEIFKGKDDVDPTKK